MPSLISECIKSAGGTNEGVLLYRIGYWDRRNLRDSQTDRWSKKSHEDWAEDTGLSPHQIKRAVAELRKLNLVEVKRGLFDNRNVSFIRLSTRAIALFDPGKSASIKQGKSAPFYVSENLSENLSEDSEPKVSQEKNTVAKKTGQAMLPEVKEDVNVKASEVLAKYHSGKPTRTSKVTDLALAFKEGYAAHTGKMALNLTQKEQGQLSVFKKKMPPGVEAITVLTKVLKDWVGFCEQVKASAGLKSVPLDPSIPFLVSYAASAINFTPVIVTEQAKKSTTFVVAKKDDDIANPLEMP